MIALLNIELIFFSLFIISVRLDKKKKVFIIPSRAFFLWNLAKL